MDELNTTKTILSEEKKKKKEKPKSGLSPLPMGLIGGSGLLGLIHDSLSRVLFPDGVHEEDEVEFTEDADDTFESTGDDFGGDMGDMGGGDTASFSSEVKTDSPCDMPTSDFEVLEEDDFDKSDPVVEHFNNEMGGTKAIIKVLKLSKNEAAKQLKFAYKELSRVRAAHNANNLTNLFHDINSVANGKGAKYQLSAVNTIDAISNHFSTAEVEQLMKVKACVLSGTDENLDARSASTRPRSPVRSARR